MSEEILDQADASQKYQHAVMPTFTSVSDWDGQKAYAHLSSSLLSWKQVLFSLKLAWWFVLQLPRSSQSHFVTVLYWSKYKMTPLLDSTSWHESSKGYTSQVQQLFSDTASILFRPIPNTLL